MWWLPANKGLYGRSMVMKMTSSITDVFWSPEVRIVCSLNVRQLLAIGMKMVSISFQVKMMTQDLYMLLIGILFHLVTDSVNKGSSMLLYTYKL